MNFLLTLLFAFPASAANERATPAGGVPCHEEVQKLCPGLNGLKSVADCLLQHEAKVGPECRGYLGKLKAYVMPSNSMEDDLVAGRGGGGRGIPGIGGSRPSLSYGGWYTPYAAPAGLQFHQARLGFPIYQNERDAVSLSLSGNTTAYDRSFTIPAGPALPSRFYAAELGAQYSHRTEGGHTFGMSAQLGKASDQPFKDKTVIGASITFSAPSPPHSRWIYGVFYSNNSTFLNGIPVPGVAYMYVTEDFVGIFGFPFASVRWRPRDPYTLSASVLGSNVALEAAYGDRRALQGFVAVRTQRYSYMRYGRLNVEDRVVLADQRAGGGIRFPVLGSLETELEAGYAFGRSIYESDKVSFHVDSSVPRAYFDNSWFAGWNFRIPLN